VRILQLLKRAAGNARVQGLAADTSHRTANEIAANLFGSGYGRLQVLQVPQCRHACTLVFVSHVASYA
jgi:hypothetical protein